jgi:sialidase-1
MKNLPAILVTAVLLLVPRLHADPDNRVVFTVEASPEHPRNTEGSFVTLKSGRIVLFFSEFNRGKEDFSRANISEVHSDDQGLTWTQPVVVFEHGENLNVMSVSVLRLASGKIAIVYSIKKNALDCRPIIRISTDETATWSEPRPIVQAPGYFVVNNDRVIQTRSGRIIVPAAFHRSLTTVDRGADTNDSRGITLWYYSDDEGATWQQSPTWWSIPVVSESGLQEPGVVELADGSLYSWARTDQGCQYSFRSQDDGKTWSAPAPTDLKSPLSPASIKRLPDSSALLAIYDDHSGRFPFDPDRRAPLVAAVSGDGGRTWSMPKVIEGIRVNWYCYTAIHFTGHSALLAYWVKDDKLTPENIKKGRMGRLRIRCIDLSWFPSGQ